MPSLEDLARILGGVVGATRHTWLDTTIGGLRAAVIRRVRPDTGEFVFDLVVATSSARELDPTHPYDGDEWILDSPAVIPRLRHGYVFAGCRAGLLYATAVTPTSVAQIIGVLWELAAWARLPWRLPEPYEPTAEREEARQRRLRLFVRLGLVIAAVVLAVVLG